MVCNGMADCPDGEDEKECYALAYNMSRSVTATQFFGDNIFSFLPKIPFYLRKRSKILRFPILTYSVLTKNM